MPALIALGTFITISLVVYGILYRPSGGGAMEARLGGLRYTRPKREALPDPEAAFSARVLQPLIGGLSRRVQGVLPSTISERLETALLQAGVKVKPGQFILIVAVMMGVFPLLLVAMFAASGPKMALIAWAQALSCKALPTAILFCHIQLDLT